MLTSRAFVRRLLAVVLLAALPAPRAEAVTIRDIVELSHAGLSDDILVALIEVDGTIFSLDAQKLLELKVAGVSERVLIAMLRNGRTPTPQAEVTGQTTPPPASPDPLQASPPVVIIEEHHEPYPVVVTVPVAVPVVVPVVASRLDRRARIRQSVVVSTERTFGRFVNDGTTNLLDGRTFGRFINDGTTNVVVDPPAESQTVYWGWGGKRRPDTWKP